MMIGKFPVWIGAVALSAVALAGAKSYEVTLPAAAKAGNVELTPGKYKVKVEGSNAVFTNSENRASVTVPVKIENTETKYGVTAVDISKQTDNQEHLTSIELGGSKTKLEFGK